MPHMRKSHARDAVAARTGREVDDLLRELYVDRGYNFSEIAEALGVSRELVRQWIETAGLRDQRPPAAGAIA